MKIEFFFCSFCICLGGCLTIFMGYVGTFFVCNLYVEMKAFLCIFFDAKTLDLLKWMKKFKFISFLLKIRKRVRAN